MRGPPTSSASVNCQPTRSASSTPSSTTRFVEATSNAIAAVKSAPLRKSERASATAAYEQDDDAAPSPAAVAIERGESSGSSRLISRFETTACTAPDSAKPRIRPQSICHAIAAATPTACTSASMSCPTSSQYPNGSSRQLGCVATRPCRSRRQPDSAVSAVGRRGTCSGKGA